MDRCDSLSFQVTSKGSVESKAVVPRGSRAVAPKAMPGPVAMKKEQGMLVPEGRVFFKSFFKSCKPGLKVINFFHAQLS